MARRPRVYAAGLRGARALGGRVLLDGGADLEGRLDGLYEKSRLELALGLGLGLALGLGSALGLRLG